LYFNFTSTDCGDRFYVIFSEVLLWNYLSDCTTKVCIESGKLISATSFSVFPMMIWHLLIGLILFGKPVQMERLTFLITICAAAKGTGIVDNHKQNIGGIGRNGIPGI